MPPPRISKTIFGEQCVFEESAPVAKDFSQSFCEPAARIPAATALPSSYNLFNIFIYQIYYIYYILFIYIYYFLFQPNFVCSLLTICLPFIVHHIFFHFCPQDNLHNFKPSDASFSPSNEFLVQSTFG